MLEDEVNEENIEMDLQATVIIKSSPNECSDTEEEDFGAVDNKELPAMPSSTSGNFDQIGSFQSMPSGMSTNSIIW